MKSLMAIGALIGGVVQLVSYLIAKSRFKSMVAVDGVILQSKLDDSHDTKGKRSYQANVVYKYVFEGKEYTYNNPVLRSFQLAPNHEYEYEIVGKYKAGQNVKLRLNPNRPHQSYLEIAPLSKMSTVVLIIGTCVSISYLVLVGWANYQ